LKIRSGHFLEVVIVDFSSAGRHQENFGRTSQKMPKLPKVPNSHCNFGAPRALRRSLSVIHSGTDLASPARTDSRLNTVQGRFLLTVSEDITVSITGPAASASAVGVLVWGRHNTKSSKIKHQTPDTKQQTLKLYPSIIQHFTKALLL